jgi:hypothetical protein
MGDTKIMGKDIYFWNFLVLMILVWAILIGVGIIKAYGIAAFFMHLKGDPVIYTLTALFPIAFVVLMLWGIGLSNPDSILGLPAWCSPNWDYSYVTN